jgi:hypothetical protein
MGKQFVCNLSCVLPVRLSLAVHLLMRRSGGNDEDWTVPIGGPALQLHRDKLTAGVDVEFGNVVDCELGGWSVD